ncbi:hypothetical protein C1925_16320 [Stenotrophomonas sp. SAU14A_NAIMI4_5]|nr:hypothetical protein C1925_16320 [Stenotrophomonas sp. SAU14A_NAIMI4_5]
MHLRFVGGKKVAASIKCMFQAGGITVESDHIACVAYPMAMDILCNISLPIVMSLYKLDNQKFFIIISHDLCSVLSNLPALNILETSRCG